jgi:glycosyltransferase involved in cell wall biosynthesis
MGPHSAELAMALGLPVMATDTGMVGVILKENNAGVILPKYDYDVWQKEIEKAVSGQKIKAVPRDEVMRIFDKNRVVNEYINVYLNAIHNFKGAV